MGIKELEDRYYTLEETAQFLGLKVSALKNRLYQKRDLPKAIKVGNRWLFPKEDFQNYIKEKEEKIS